MKQWFPFFPGDYLRDTAMLEPEQHGVYLLLMMEYYSTGQPIPDDRFAIAKICRISPQKAGKNLEKIRKFFKEKNGFLYHDKIEDIMAKSLELSEKLSKAGKKGREKQLAKAQAEPGRTTTTTTTTDISKNIINNILCENSPEDATPEPVKKTRKRTVIPYQQIVELYHQILPELPKVEMLTAKRKGQLSARHHDLKQDLKRWENFFYYVKDSDFLMGRIPPSQGRKQFLANLEWLTNESNFAKIAEEKYHG